MQKTWGPSVWGEPHSWCTYYIYLDEMWHIDSRFWAVWYWSKNLFCYQTSRKFLDVLTLHEYERRTLRLSVLLTLYLWFLVVFFVVVKPITNRGIFVLNRSVRASSTIYKQNFSFKWNELTTVLTINNSVELIKELHLSFKGNKISRENL